MTVLVLMSCPGQVDGYHFEIIVPVAVSDQFYGWVFGQGKKVRSVAPESVKEGMKKRWQTSRSATNKIDRH